MRLRRPPTLEDYSGPRAPDAPQREFQGWDLCPPIVRVPLGPGVLTWRPAGVSYAPGPPPGITALGYSQFEPRDIELAPAPPVASSFAHAIARRAVLRDFADRARRDYVERLPEALRDLAGPLDNP